MEEMQCVCRLKKSKNEKNENWLPLPIEIFSQVVNSCFYFKILSIPLRFTLSQIQLCKYEAINTLICLEVSLS